MRWQDWCPAVCDRSSSAVRIVLATVIRRVRVGLTGHEQDEADEKPFQAFQAIESERELEFEVWFLLHGLALLRGAACISSFTLSRSGRPRICWRTANLRIGGLT